MHNYEGVCARVYYSLLFYFVSLLLCFLYVLNLNINFAISVINICSTVTLLLLTVKKPCPISGHPAVV